MPSDENARPIDPQFRIGPVHLKVADLERSLRFYCGVIGFQPVSRRHPLSRPESAGRRRAPTNFRRHLAGGSPRSWRQRSPLPLQRVFR